MGAVSAHSVHCVTGPRSVPEGADIIGLDLCGKPASTPYPGTTTAAAAS